jgi:hypothetical protein
MGILGLAEKFLKVFPIFPFLWKKHLRFGCHLGTEGTLGTIGTMGQRQSVGSRYTENLVFVGTHSRASLCKIQQIQ